MLDVHRLRLLRELSVRGTLAAVADALGYSPSAISQHLSQLEREAGTRLLDRVGRGVRLTPAGELLVRHAETVLAALEEAEAALAELAGGGTGRLRVAMFTTAAHRLVTPVLSRLAETAPRLEVSVQVLEPEIALPRLAAYDLDLVLTEEYPGHPLPRHPDLHRSRLADDPLRLAVPTSWSSEGTKLADMADAAWVLEPVGTTARAWADAVCRAAGFEAKPRFESTDLFLHLRLVRDGVAVALLPGLALADPPDGVRLLRLPGDPRRRLDTLVRRGARTHPHVLAVREALAAQLANQGLPPK